MIKPTNIFKPPLFQHFHAAPDTMSNCEGVHVGLKCDFCDQGFEFDVWWLIDTLERSDLLVKVEAGTLHDAVCPGCGYANRIQSDLLLYRPTNDPVLLFSPAETAGIEESRSSLNSLLNVLKKKLGSNWRDEWIAKGVIGVQRSHLASVIRQRDDAFKNRDIPDENPLALIQKLICAEQWDGTRIFLLQNPSLLDKRTQHLFDEIVSHAEAAGDRQAQAMFDEYRQLLQRCREIGVEAAITEKRTSSGMAI